MFGLRKELHYICRIAFKARELNSPIQNVRRLHFTCRNYCDNSEKKVPGFISSRYEPFVDDKSPIILDVEEERRRFKEGILDDEESELPDPFENINPERGVNGVLEIEEVVQILKGEKGKDMVVIEVPEAYKYVDYMVIVTGSSKKHLHGMATFLRRVYKYKRHKKDRMPDVEGGNSMHWLALDVGNIVVHFLSPSARKQFDLESLWAVGQEYDSLSNEKEDHVLKLTRDSTAFRNTLCEEFEEPEEINVSEEKESPECSSAEQNRQSIH